MIPPDEFETQRLVLRKPSLDDAFAIFEGYASDLVVTKYLTWRPHADIGATRAFLQRCLKVWEDGSGFPWVIMLKESNALIGMIEIRVAHHTADFGYVIAQPYWGRGFATEAARVVVGWALSQSKVYRVWAICDLENIASARVMEKVGMQREGILRRYIVHPNVSAEPRDCFCYSVVR